MKILNILKKMGLCINLMILTITVNGASSEPGAGAECDEVRELNSIVRPHTQHSLIEEINLIMESSDVNATVKKAKKVTLRKHGEITSKFYDKVISHYLSQIFEEKSVKMSQYYFSEAIKDFNEFLGTIHSSELDDFQFNRYKNLKKQILIRSFDVRTAIRRHFNSIHMDSSFNLYNNQNYGHKQELTYYFQIKYIFEDLLGIFILNKF